MKKIVCLQNIFVDGSFVLAGKEIVVSDEMAVNLVERNLVKYVGTKPEQKKDNETKSEVPVNGDDTEGYKAGSNELADTSTTNFGNSCEPPKVSEEVTDAKTTPVIDDDQPRRGRPPKNKNRGKKK
jgi:hypothetical protein